VPGEASRTISRSNKRRRAITRPASRPIRRGSIESFPAVRSWSCPRPGFYRESEETKPQAVNTALLSEISRVTGGRMHPSIDQLLTDKGHAWCANVKPCGHTGLSLHWLLNFLEVALRKGFFERLVAWLLQASSRFLDGAASLREVSRTGFSCLLLQFPCQRRKNLNRDQLRVEFPGRQAEARPT
jgi:hypothetical protein